MRLFVADDRRLVLAGVQSVLADAYDIEIVGTATGGAQVLPLVHELRPDVALLDAHLSGMDGLTCLQRIRLRQLETRVVLMAETVEPAHAAAAKANGASGYVSRSVEGDELADALRTAADADGEFVTAGAAEPDDRAAARGAGLTAREIDILSEVARGQSNKAIARELWVTEQTVKFHLTNIYGKLGVANRTEAARAALALGISAEALLV